MKEFKDDDLGTKEWENKVMFSLKLLNIYSILAFFLIYALPTYKGDGWFDIGIYKFLILIALAIGLFSRNGRIANKDPMVFVLSCRFLQFLTNMLLFKDSLSWVTYLFSLLLELSVVIWFYVDSTNNVYVKEREI